MANQVPTMEKVGVLHGKGGHRVQKSVLFVQNTLHQRHPVFLLNGQNDLVDVNGNDELEAVEVFVQAMIVG